MDEPQAVLKMWMATTSVAYGYNSNGNILTDGLEGVSMEYDINNMVRRVKTSLGDTLATYLYFADGEKHGVTTAEAVSGNSSGSGSGSGVNGTSEITGRRYIGPFTLREQRAAGANTTTTVLGLESAAPSGGELLYVNNPAYGAAPSNTASPYLTLVYHRDHLAGVRAITKTDGTILEQNDYYPFGLRTTRKQSYTTLSQSLASIAQSAGNTTANTSTPRYLYNGKEKQELGAYTSNYIDYGARFYNPVTLRWNTQDPMAEKYQRYSPYAYCVNNPINYIDPNGTFVGDYVNEHMKYLGNDGRDDGKLYLVTDKKEAHTVKKNHKQGRSTKIEDVKSAQELPSYAVRQEMKNAYERSNAPNNNRTDNFKGDDDIGGLHEEGGLYGLDAQGQQVASPAIPGKKAKDRDDTANIDMADPATDITLKVVQGTYHVHPKGLWDGHFEPTPTVPSDYKVAAQFPGNSYVISTRNIYMFNGKTPGKYFTISNMGKFFNYGAPKKYPKIRNYHPIHD